MGYVARVRDGLITACVEPVTQDNPATSGHLNMLHLRRARRDRKSLRVHTEARACWCERRDGCRRPAGAPGTPRAPGLPVPPAAGANGLLLRQRSD